MVQEPGHNFGMQHSSSMDCGSASFADNPNDGTCTHSEYGDRYDPMGGGCKHMNAWQKTYNGWTQGCNMVRVRSSGTFTLAAAGAGLRRRSGAADPDAQDAHVHALGRRRIGDQRLAHALLPRAAHQARHRQCESGDSDVRAGSRLRRHQGPQDCGLHTWILDMDPATSSFDGLTVGKTFTDPGGGVSFTVTELDENHATVNVTMTANGGGPVCMDGTTAFTAPGPGIESCNAGIRRRAAAVGGAGGATGTGGTTGRWRRAAARPAAPRAAAAARGGTTGGRGGSTGGSAAGSTGKRRHDRERGPRRTTGASASRYRRQRRSGRRRFDGHGRQRQRGIDRRWRRPQQRRGDGRFARADGSRRYIGRQHCAAGRPGRHRRAARVTRPPGRCLLRRYAVDVRRLLPAVVTRRPRRRFVGAPATKPPTGKTGRAALAIA